MQQTDQGLYLYPGDALSALDSETGAAVNAGSQGVHTIMECILQRLLWGNSAVVCIESVQACS
jgi:hypothetical protein